MQIPKYSAWVSAIASLTLMAGGCANPIEIPPAPVYSVKSVSAAHLDGVGDAECPSGFRVVGGGCTCRGLGDFLFGSSPVGNSFLCACYDGRLDSIETVEATALCLGSDTPGTLKQGLIAKDPLVEAALQDLRAQRQAHP